MTLLTTVQHFCRRTNLNAPSTASGSVDPQIKQIVALLEEEGNDLSKRGAWTALTYEASHTTLNQEDQGAISTIASNGFRYIKNETIWDRSDTLAVIGPMGSKEWQALKAVANNGPRYQYRIRGGKLLVNPVPVAGHDWRFEYVSKNWILGNDGVTYKQYFTQDEDTILLPEDLVLMGLRWRWKKEKGMDYAEDMRTYEMQLKDELGRDGGKQTLHMDNYDPQRGPGVFIPQYSWNVP